MKLRLGFVSNSSSASFVVCKDDIKNITEFEEMVKEHNRTCNEGYLHIGKKYIFGKLDMNVDNYETIVFYLKDRNIYFEQG